MKIFKVFYDKDIVERVPENKYVFAFDSYPVYQFVYDTKKKDTSYIKTIIESVRKTI